jgi:L-alanine-DL-glutamate epimerase-like enolase superfamily enzyme
MKAFVIKKIILYRCEVQANFNYWFAKRTTDTVLLANVQSHAGNGWGECISLDNSDFSSLHKFAEKLVGKSLLCLGAILPSELDTHLNVRECLEIALLDLLGKSTGLPAHSLLGGKKFSRIPGMPVIHLGEPEEMAEKARKWDYSFFKVKMMCKPDKDISIIETIRKVNKSFVLYVDFNCGYSDVDEAIRVMNQLGKLGVSVAEDPVSESIEIEGYKEIHEKTDVQLMIDTKARSLERVFKIVKNDAADIINLHTSVQGGLSRALEKAVVAKAAGIPCIVGSDGFLGITDSAYQSLGSVILNKGFPCEEVGGKHYHGVCIVKKAYVQKKGMIHIPDTPGLGVEIDRAKLEPIVVERASIE